VCGRTPARFNHLARFTEVAKDGTLAKTKGQPQHAKSSYLVSRQSALSGRACMHGLREE
jgi:hypothetical protein